MLRFLIPLLMLALAMPATLAAQSPYRVVAQVNAEAITAYEVDQRAAFLRVVRAPGAGPDLALEQLIDDRLKIGAAARAGIVLSEDGLRNGMADFAGRANLELDEFLVALRGQGVEEGTLREFIRSGLSWRELIRRRFGSRAQITEDEIDRAQGLTEGGARVRVLLNELVLPARPGRGGEIATAQRNAQRIQQITSISRFQAEASRLSVSQSRGRGGRLNWIELSELPAGLRPVLLGLAPGEVTQPFQTENALILFQLRDIEELEGAPRAASAIDYAALYLPAGSGRVDRIVNRIDTCDDLYGEARRLPPEALERGAKPVAEIPEDVALELAKLDPGETSTVLTRAGGETTVLLMLCARVPNLEDGGNREGIREQLRQRRLEGFADGLLAELRAQAVIVTQ